MQTSKIGSNFVEVMTVTLEMVNHPKLEVTIALLQRIVKVWEIGNGIKVDGI